MLPCGTDCQNSHQHSSSLLLWQIIAECDVINWHLSNQLFSYQLVVDAVARTGDFLFPAPQLLFRNQKMDSGNSATKQFCQPAASMKRRDVRLAVDHQNIDQ